MCNCSRRTVSRRNTVIKSGSPSQKPTIRTSGNGTNSSISSNGGNRNRTIRRYVYR